MKTLCLSFLILVCISFLAALDFHFVDNTSLNGTLVGKRAGDLYILDQNDSLHVIREYKLKAVTWNGLDYTRKIQRRQDFMLVNADSKQPLDSKSKEFLQFEMNATKTDSANVGKSIQADGFANSKKLEKQMLKYAAIVPQEQLMKMNDREYDYFMRMKQVNQTKKISRTMWNIWWTSLGIAVLGTVVDELIN